MYFKLMLGTLILSVLIYGFASFIMLRKKRKKLAKYEIYHQNKTPPAIFRILYRYLSAFALTRGYVAKVRHRYEMIEPGDTERIERDTIINVLFVFGLAAFLIVLAFILGFSLFYSLISLFTLYVCNNAFNELSIEQKRGKILRQLKGELENLQNNYNKSFDISDAIYETAVNAPDPLSSHLKIIWDILQCDAGVMNQRIEEYNISAPNPYLKDLLACSKEIAKYDDSKVGGISNYIRKLTVIINAVAIEERKQETIRSKFKGQAIVCVFPIYTTPILIKVSRSMFEIDAFMNGTYGILAHIVAFAISLICYSLVQNKKNMDYVCATSHPTLRKISELPLIRGIVTYMEKSNIKRRYALESKLHKIGESMTVRQFFTQRILFAILGFIATLILCFFIQINAKDMALSDSSNMDIQLLEGYSSEDEHLIYGELTDFANSVAGGKYNQETLIEELKKSPYFKSDARASLAVAEIQRRVNKYQNAYFKWWYYLIALANFGLFSYIPYALINKNRTLVQMKADDEVMRFQNIISCMKNIERAGTKEILEEMELSASIFRNSLTECVDEYASDPIGALHHFMLREKDVDLLQRISVKFIRADRVGVYNAFANLDEEIVEAHKAREQKNNDYIQRAGTLTYAFAFLPIFFVLVLEMIAPMALATMSQLALLDVLK